MENSKTENMTNTAEGMKNAESTVNAVRYEDAPIDERIIRAVQEMGFEVMTPIQQQAIPALLEGRDVLGQAQTGTGERKKKLFRIFASLWRMVIDALLTSSVTVI